MNRRQRVWPLVLIFMGSLLGALLSRWVFRGEPASAEAAAAHAKVVTAERFVLVDKKGKTRAELEMMVEGMPGLAFYDNAKKLRVHLGLAGDEIPSLALYDKEEKLQVGLMAKPDGSSGLALFDKEGKKRAACHLSAEGDPSLTLFGNNGEPGVVCRVTARGWPMVQLYGPIETEVSGKKVEHASPLMALGVVLGQPILTFRGRQTRDRLIAALDPQGNAFLWLRDKEGDREAFLCGSQLSLSQSRDMAEAILGFRSDEPCLTLTDKGGREGAVLGRTDIAHRRGTTSYFYRRPVSSLVLYNNDGTTTAFGKSTYRACRKGTPEDKALTDQIIRARVAYSSKKDIYVLRITPMLREKALVYREWP